jgi:hypothetical protein
MPLLPRSLKWRVRLLTLLGLAAVLGPLGYFYWRPVKGYVLNQLAIIRERDDPNPVTRGLARGEIRPGSSVDELEAAHPPKRAYQYGRFRELCYENGPTVTAMDGKLVCAVDGWCSHAILFFNTLTPAEEMEYSASVSSYWDERAEQSKAPHRAVGGVMGYMPCCQPYCDLAYPPPDEKPWEAEEAAPHRAIGGVTGYMSWCSPYWQLASPELVEPSGDKP